MEWDEVKGRNCVFIGRGNVVVKALGGAAKPTKELTNVCVIVYNSNNRETKLSIQIMRRERQVGNGKHRILRDLESEGVCVCF